MQIEMGDIGGSCTIEFKTATPSRNNNNRNKNNKKSTNDTTSSKRTKRCIIMDEVDGMGAGDRSGIAELIQMIKHTRVPIICICNDRQNQKLKSLIPYCMDLKYRRPVKSVIANRAIEVAQREGLQVERNAAEAIVESCGNDVRQVLNCLHMWASNKKNKSNNNMTYKDLKDRENSINKDEILRVSLFDATRVIVEGRRGLSGADMVTARNHFFQRNDAFFVDYSFIGLMVHQNYLKVMQGQYNEVKRTNDDIGTNNFLRRMSDAADTMSDFAQVENSMRSGQGWSLLPFTAALAVKTGYHAGGERGSVLPGFPEFTTWLGRNSTKGKKIRLLKEIQHHMNYSVSGATHEIRMSYLPVLRERFLSMLTNSRTADVEGAIEIMDEYGLDRDDIFEKFDEFKMDPKGRDFSSMDSKMKAAFTRTYNQGVHKSQALVAEQGGGSKKSARGGSTSAGLLVEAADLDAIDDDKIIEVDDEQQDDEEDEEKIKAMFKKKGSRSSNTSSTTTGKGKQTGTRKRKS
jgi:replication factor C subunit 1